MNTKMTVFTWAFFLSGLAYFVPEMIHAATLDDELSGGLCNIVSALTGRAGRAIASIGIIILGIGAFFGKINWGLAMTVAIGVMLIFAAGNIVQALGGPGQSTVTVPVFGGIVIPTSC